MDEPRYAVRRGGPALTRRQWIRLTVILVVGVVGGAVLAVTVSLGAGGILLGLTAILTAVLVSFGLPAASTPPGRE